MDNIFVLLAFIFSCILLALIVLIAIVYGIQKCRYSAQISERQAKVDFLKDETLK